MEEPSLKVIQEISDNDIDFQNSLIQILKKEFKVEVENYENNFRKQDFVEAADSVHKLKHKISLLGLEKGLILATNYERELKSGVTALHSEFKNILNKINVYLYS